MTAPQIPSGPRHSAPSPTSWTPSGSYPHSGRIPTQWGPPPQWMPPRPPVTPAPPANRGVGFGVAALVAGVVALLLGLLGTAGGFVVGVVAIGLAVVGYVRTSGRALGLVGGGLGVLAIVASAVLPSTVTGPASVPTSPVRIPTAAPATTVVAAPVAPPAPARAITARDWQKIAKDPSAHTGESVVVYGSVTQFDAATGTESFRADVDGVRHQDEYDYETNTYLTGQASTLSDVVQGDMFRAEVVVGAPYTYETTMGGQMTVPTLVITKITPIR